MDTQLRAALHDCAQGGAPATIDVATRYCKTAILNNYHRLPAAVTSDLPTILSMVDMWNTHLKYEQVTPARAALRAAS